MSMMWMRMPGQTWLASAAMFLLMWLAMMVAMMLPSVLPILLRYRLSQATTGIPHPGLMTALVAAGYFAVWTMIGFITYLIGAVWALATMQWPALSAAVPALTGAALALAGMLQFSRWTMTGLGQCRNATITETHCATTRLLAGWLYGLHQGRCCVRCCSGPMLALLVLGTMNLFVMIAVAAVITAEKLLPKPRPVISLTGFAAILAGSAIFVSSLS
jgi:predicted metal-binding membrane protein